MLKNICIFNGSSYNNCIYSTNFVYNVCLKSSTIDENIK